jgi:hypothetical protein
MIRLLFPSGRHPAFGLGAGFAHFQIFCLTAYTAWGYETVASDVEYGG